MTAVIPDMDPTRPARVHPPNIIRADRGLGRHEHVRLAGVAQRRQPLGRRAWQSNCRRCGASSRPGAPVPAAVIERMTQMLGPDAEVFTPYGATECLPVASIGSREILGETRRQTGRRGGVCVGRPVPEVEVAIIPISDDPISRLERRHCGCRRTRSAKSR